MTTNRRGFRKLFIAVATATPFALAGCGGGGSMTTMEEPEPLTIPDGFAASSATPVTATSTTDTMAELLPNPANLFVPLMAMFSGDPSAQSPSSELTGDVRVKTVSSDGNNGFHVTYEVGGEESTIHFEADDYNEGQYFYGKTVDGILYFLGTWTDSFEGPDKNQGARNFAYFDVNNFGQYDEATGATDRSFVVYGARTDGSNLPAGSASYIGRMRARAYPTDDPTTSDTNRDNIWGSVRLTADFDESAVEGMVFGIRMRRAGEDSSSRLSDTTYFAIKNGRVVDGQFAAALSGEDSNQSAAMDSTVRGYEGNVLGEFYGPAAEEVGAVLNASRSDRVLYGWLGGWQPDPNPPSGLHRSTAAPVYATHGGGDIEDLFDAGEVFAPLTSTLDTSRNWSRVERSSDSYVKTISSDGGDGIRVTYVVRGEEQTVHFLPTDYIEDGGYWSKGGEVELWLSGGGDYYETGGMWIGVPGGNLRPFWTEGARTNAADLPAGTATYVGYMRAEDFSQADSSNTVRYSLGGDLSLTADFDASKLEGQITNISKRWREPRPRVWIDLPDTTRFDISDGQIADGQFTATLTGADTNESAPLHDSVRGYEGDVLGEFYGPAAEEVGGVISATREADLRVMGGTIHGHQQ